MNTGHNQGAGVFSCLLFLIVVGIAGFALLGGKTVGPTPVGPVGPANEPIRDSGFEQPAAGRVEQHPDASDWSLDSVPTQQKQSKQISEADNANSKRTQAGDWGMEEVPTGSKEPKDSAVKPESKSTRQGDWGMEEVGGKKGE